MPRLSKTFWIRIEAADALSAVEWEYYIKKSYDYIFAALAEKVKQSLQKPS
jgi:predicted DNA-binding protein (MmcQ/YjbR family)